MVSLQGYQNFVPLNGGGMAQLYRATQRSLDRPVVVKFLSEKLLSNAVALKLFEQESLVVARLNHPNIVHVIDKGVDATGHPYFVMEWVAGKELGEYIHSRTLTTVQCSDILLQLARGLAYAHRNGIVHRDIKPANILVNAENQIRILDFGIAHITQQPNDEVTTLILAGTPDYMAPEQNDVAADITTAADIYALGVIGYELFSGQLPDRSKWPPTTHWRVKIPAPLVQLLRDCIAHNPGQRPTCDSIIAGLLTLQRGAHLGSGTRKEAEQGLEQLNSKFVLLDVVSRKPHSAVYLYQDSATSQLLTIKKLAADAPGLQAAKQLAGIQHQNLIRIHGTSTSQRIYIIVMAYLSGGNLRERLAQQFSGKQFLSLAGQILSALACAHGHSIYHGNLRPENVLFDESGNVCLTDFGQVHADAQPPDEPTPAPAYHHSPIISDLADLAELLHYSLALDETAAPNHDRSLDPPPSLKRWLERLRPTAHTGSFVSANMALEALKKIQDDLLNWRQEPSVRSLAKHRSWWHTPWPWLIVAINLALALYFTLN